MNGDMDNRPIVVAQATLDSAIDRCLERQAEPRIAADFAAKVMAELPAAPARKRIPELRRKMAMVAAVVLLCAIFVLAPHTSGTFANAAFDFELVLLAQLSGIAWWLGSHRKA
jgi:hypothetical protein